MPFVRLLLFWLGRPPGSASVSWVGLNVGDCLLSAAFFFRFLVGVSSMAADYFSLVFVVWGFSPVASCPYVTYGLLSTVAL